MLPRMHINSTGARMYPNENGADFLRHLEYILNYVLSDLNILLGMSYHSAAYGTLVYERAGSIKALIDSQLRKKWDLVTCLVELEFNDSFGDYPREETSRSVRKMEAESSPGSG
jgi:hypothetical protein